MDSQRYLYLWQNEKPPEITLSVKFLRLRGRRGLPARAWPSSNFPGTLVWARGLSSLGEGAALQCLLGCCICSPRCQGELVSRMSIECTMATGRLTSNRICVRERGKPGQMAPKLIASAAWEEPWGSSWTIACESRPPELCSGEVSVPPLAVLDMCFVAGPPLACLCRAVTV